MRGMFVTSKAGHDKNQVYIIYEETEEYAYLVDGLLKKIQNPKKKNKKHIQPINKMVSQELIHKMENKLPIQNEEIKREIKQVYMHYSGGNICQKQM